MTKKSFFLIAAMTLCFVQCSNPTQNTPMTPEPGSKDSCCSKDTADKKAEVAMQTEITCPQCGHKKMETMPTDVCVIKYNCGKCGVELRPKHGDCCVFCTYGTHKCPSMQ